MKHTKSYRLTCILLALVIASLACSFGNKEETPAPEKEKIADKGLLRQWAAQATASSEYDDPDYSAWQATGEPDTPGCGDYPTAWNSEGNNTAEWIELEYDQPVIPTQVNIHQTYTPSSVVMVILHDTEGGVYTVYRAEPEKEKCPYVLEIDIDDVDKPVDKVQITLNQEALGNWNSIDAVELVGRPGDGEETALEPTESETEAGEPTAAAEPTKLPKPAGGDIPPFNLDEWEWVYYNEANGFVENLVRALAPTPDGGLWAATGNKNVAYFDGNTWTSYTPDTGPQVTYASSIVVDGNGVAWFGGYGVTRYDGETVTQYTQDDGLVSNAVNAMTIAEDGTLWVAAANGVSHFDGSAWESWTLEDGIPDKNVIAIAVTPDDEVWIGTWNGAAHFDGSNWTVYTSENGLPNSMVKAVAIAPDGAVWLGTSGGAARFQDGLWETFMEDEGLFGAAIIDIELAPDGSLWFATEGWGISHYDGKNWVKLAKEDGLPDLWHDAIAIAADGSIWITVRNYGLARLVKK